MRAQTIDLPMLDIRAALSNIDDDAREVDLVFSTGAPVVRYDWRTDTRYIERLSMEPKHIRLDRLNNGAPILDTHSAWSLASQIGAVKTGSAKIAKGEGTLRARFSKRKSVDETWQDVRDRIVTKASVGYAVHRYEETAGKDGGLPTRLAIDWEPFEVSMVPIAADDRSQTRSRTGNGNDQMPLPVLYPCVIHRSGGGALADLDLRFRFLQLLRP